MAYSYPQQPAPRSRPAAVTISSYLLYLVAAVEAGWTAAGVTWGAPADPSAPVPTPTDTATA